MKITIFNGSPHAEDGNTQVIVEEFLKGAKEAGAGVEVIFLTKKHINHCIGCYSCWINTPGKCIINDDMEELLFKYISSDIVVFATPLYMYGVTGIMKDFADRLIPLLDPHFEEINEAECRHLKRFKKYPKLMVIANCGFPEKTHFEVLSLFFKRFARNMHSEFIAEIYRGSGEILREPTFEPFVSEYKKTVRKAGREIVENLKFSEETVLQLKKPIIPDDQYIKIANQNWDRLLKE